MRWLIRSFFRTLRAVIGPFLLLGEWLTRPRGLTRSDEEQRSVDDATRHLALYQFKTCPFCIKARRAIARLSLDIPLLDAQFDAAHREALLEGGGEVKVPCLRINHADGRVEWMYESDDIIRYLQQRFGKTG